MTKERRLEMLSALAGGAIIKAWPDKKHTHPWIDFRGRGWTNAEIKEAKRTKIAEDVQMVNFTEKGMEELRKEQS